jgi:hypothetical protein
MGSQKWNRAGEYGAAGVAAGGAIGSVVPVIGTGIGALVGGAAGLIGGFIGGTIEDNNDAKALENQLSEQEKEKSRAKKDAYQQFMLNEAAGMGANPTLVNYARLKSGMGQIDRASDAQRGQIQANYDAATAYNPATTVALGTSLANAGQSIYRQANAPQAAPLSAEAFQALGNGNGGKPLVTPSASQDLGVSPEVTFTTNPEDLQTLRAGRRMTF